MSWKDEIVSVLEKHFGGSKQEEPVEDNIAKSLDEEQRMALFVILEPQSGEYTSDLHEDTYDEDDVWKACNSYNQHSMKANLFHRLETEDMKIVQSFTTPAAFTLKDGREVKKGSWLAWTYFPETKNGEILWKGVQSGSFNGLSIQCRATSTEINNAEDDNEAS